MRYQTTAPFRGESSKALDFAISVLTGAGFRLGDRTPISVEMTGRGMNSSSESPLRGASTIRLERRDGQLALDADLGGIARMAKFVTWFPNILCFGLAVVMVAIFLQVHGPGPWIAIVLGAAAANGLLWLVLGPFIARILQTRTQRELDTLLANAVAMG